MARWLRKEPYCCKEKRLTRQQLKPISKYVKSAAIRNFMRTLDKSDPTMPLSLEEAYLALRKLAKSPKHVQIFGQHLQAWFFEPTSDPNIEYEIVMRYDSPKLKITEVRIVHIEPPAMTDITQSWQGNTIVEGVVR